MYINASLFMVDVMKIKCKGNILVNRTLWFFPSETLYTVIQLLFATNFFCDLSKIKWFAATTFREKALSNLGFFLNYNFMENTCSQQKIHAEISRTRIKVVFFYTIATSRASLAALWKTFSNLSERPLKKIGSFKDYFKIWVC